MRPEQQLEAYRAVVAPIETYRYGNMATMASSQVIRRKPL